MSFVEECHVLCVHQCFQYSGGSDFTAALLETLHVDFTVQVFVSMRACDCFVMKQCNCHNLNE